jgi:hypothetical protein
VIAKIKCLFYLIFLSAAKGSLCDYLTGVISTYYQSLDLGLRRMLTLLNLARCKRHATQGFASSILAMSLLVGCENPNIWRHQSYENSNKSLKVTSLAGYPMNCSSEKLNFAWQLIPDYDGTNAERSQVCFSALDYLGSSFDNGVVDEIYQTSLAKGKLDCAARISMRLGEFWLSIGQKFDDEETGGKWMAMTVCDQQADTPMTAFLFPSIGSFRIGESRSRLIPSKALESWLAKSKSAGSHRDIRLVELTWASCIPAATPISVTLNRPGTEDGLLKSCDVAFGSAERTK